ncbi:MAG: hypothetical protein JSS91_14465 [Bacteroidetes bacterium]|nr:hypothetical protein [Bacteroidota bacterium]
MNKNLPVSNNNTGSGILPEKLNRKKFFVFTGLAALGIAAASVIPFNLFRSNTPKPAASLKIKENPNAVKRKSKEANSELNNG